MKSEAIDQTVASADWLKFSWELPPYKSVEFFLLWPDLEAFKKLPIYQAACDQGLIYDDEWVDDFVVERKSKKFDYKTVQKGCGCGMEGHADLRLLKASSTAMPPGKKYVLANEEKVASKVARLFAKYRDLTEKAISKRLPKPQKADLAGLLRKSASTDEIVAAVLKEINLDGLSVGFIEELTADLVAAFKAGGISGLEAVGMQNDQKIVELVPLDAVEFAKTRAAELVGKKYDEESGKYVDNPNPTYSITDTTREGIRDLTETALEEGWSAQDLKKNILEEHFFSEKRAETIARTELAFAHVQGNLKAWEATGRVGGKRSLLADTHPLEDECDENADAGVVGFDDVFPSGDEGPPYHPMCLCSLIPILKSEMEDDEAAD